MPTKKRQSKTWTVDEKVRILAEASKLIGAQLTSFLEREGLLLAELEQWRLALGDETKPDIATKKRMAKLDRELARKEKAFAEAVALLVRKQIGAPQEGRGRPHRRGERQMILSVAAEAEAAGARLESVCELLGISDPRCHDGPAVQRNVSEATRAAPRRRIHLPRLRIDDGSRPT